MSWEDLHGWYAPEQNSCVGFLGKNLLCKYQNLQPEPVCNKWGYLPKKRAPEPQTKEVRVDAVSKMPE